MNNEVERRLNTSTTSMLSLMGKRVTVVPKDGPNIIGVFCGEERLRELSRENVFVIEVGPDCRSYIKRENVSYVTIDECGYVGNKELK
jgi:hypothetical protein